MLNRSIGGLMALHLVIEQKGPNFHLLENECRQNSSHRSSSVGSQHPRTCICLRCATCHPPAQQDSGEQCDVHVGEDEVGQKKPSMVVWFFAAVQDANLPRSIGRRCSSVPSLSLPLLSCLGDTDILGRRSSDRSLKAAPAARRLFEEVPTITSLHTKPASTLWPFQCTFRGSSG